MLYNYNVIFGSLPSSLDFFGFLYYIFLMMTIEQTVTVSADYRLFIDLPRSIPVGAKAKVSVAIPTVFDSQCDGRIGAKSFRGILKGKGITVDQLRELQREDKAFEEDAGSSLYSEIG